MDNWLKGLAVAIGPVLGLWLGLGFTLGDAVRVDNPSYDAARSLAPVTAWGLALLIGAACQTVALVLQDARLVAITYGTAGAFYAWWCFAFVAQALDNERASIVAGAPYAAIAAVSFIFASRALRSTQ